MPGIEDSHRTFVRLGSSLRERPAEQTLVIARKAMKAAGVTRGSEITRMDRLGLPVYASVRPRGALLQVHAGKGLRPIDAEVGSLMEAIEFAAAEPGHQSWRRHKRTALSIAKQLGDGIDLLDLAPKWLLQLTGDEIVDSVACDEIIRRRRVMVPAELVFLPFHPTYGNPIFGWTGNGLASGNSIEEATLHGLLEVFERDALAISRVSDASTWVEAETLPEPFGEYEQVWRELGVRLAVRFVESAVNLPCFEAFLYEPESNDVNLARGSGLHIDPSIALSRAICEAAQSRLSGIHGGREDITTFYAKYQNKTTQERLRADQKVIDRIFDRSRSMRYGEVASDMDLVGTVGDLLHAVLDRMQECGFPFAFRYRFESPADELHVVKMIVPKCEDIEHGADRIGRRLLTAAIAHSNERRGNQDSSAPRDAEASDIAATSAVVSSAPALNSSSA